MPIRLSASATSAGYKFSGNPVYSRIVGESMDVDLDGDVTALTDGLLIMRWLFGFDNSSLTGGVVSSLSERRNPIEIVRFLNESRALLDIDGSGEIKALEDGLLILRYLFGFRGQTLIDNAVNQTSATRKTAVEIENYLEDIFPID